MPNKVGSTSTQTLRTQGKAVAKKDLQPGDLVFFHTVKKDGHVGIYIGNNQFVGAQSKGIGVANMNDPYWKSRTSSTIRRLT